MDAPKSLKDTSPKKADDKKAHEKKSVSLNKRNANRKKPQEGIISQPSEWPLSET